MLVNMSTFSCLCFFLSLLLFLFFLEWSTYVLIHFGTNRHGCFSFGDKRWHWFFSAHWLKLLETHSDLISLIYKLFSSSVYRMRLAIVLELLLSSNSWLSSGFMWFYVGVKDDFVLLSNFTHFKILSCYQGSWVFSRVHSRWGWGGEFLFLFHMVLFTSHLHG